MPNFNPYAYNYQPGYYPQPMPEPMRPNQYQPPTPPAQPQAPANPMLGSAPNGIIWVQNKDEADRFMVAAGSAVALWDANNPVIYLRQADNTGKPSTTVYDLVERTDAPPPPVQPAPQVDLSQYIKRGELDSFREELDGLWDQLETIQGRLKRPAKPTKPKEESASE